MKNFILFISLVVTTLACTQEVERKKDLLTLSGELNHCLSSTKGTCCDAYNKLINEASTYGIIFDDDDTCK